MRAPVRPVRGAWPAAIERRLARFFWGDATVVLDENAAPESFRQAMAAFHVGDTIKITGADRHPEADALLFDNIDVSGAMIVDIGASDGSTSVDLIRRLDGFGSYVIADLFLTLSASQLLGHTFFYDPEGTCVLIAGRRLLAWPTVSTVVRAVYTPLLALAARRAAVQREVLMLNPSARELIRSDDRVSYAVHDVFTPWPGKRPDVIKVANLLRRLYFSDDAISTALRALLESLDEGGHLLVVDNPRIEGIDTRAGLYRRAGDRFAVVARTAETPEVDELVLSVDLAKLPKPPPMT